MVKIDINNIDIGADNPTVQTWKKEETLKKSLYAVAAHVFLTFVAFISALYGLVLILLNGFLRLVVYFMLWVYGIRLPDPSDWSFGGFFSFLDNYAVRKIFYIVEHWQFLIGVVFIILGLSGLLMLNRWHGIELPPLRYRFPDIAYADYNPRAGLNAAARRFGLYATAWVILLLTWFFHLKCSSEGRETGPYSQFASKLRSEHLSVWRVITSTVLAVSLRQNGVLKTIVWLLLFAGSSALRTHWDHALVGITFDEMSSSPWHAAITHSRVKWICTILFLCTILLWEIIARSLGDTVNRVVSGSMDYLRNRRIAAVTPRHIADPTTPTRRRKSSTLIASPRSPQTAASQVQLTDSQSSQQQVSPQDLNQQQKDRQQTPQRQQSPVSMNSSPSNSQPLSPVLQSTRQRTPSRARSGRHSPHRADVDPAQNINLLPRRQQSILTIPLNYARNALDDIITVLRDGYRLLVGSPKTIYFIIFILALVFLYNIAQAIFGWLMTILTPAASVLITSYLYGQDSIADSFSAISPHLRDGLNAARPQIIKTWWSTYVKHFLLHLPVAIANNVVVRGIGKAWETFSKNFRKYLSRAPPDSFIPEISVNVSSEAGSETLSPSTKYPHTTSFNQPTKQHSDTSTNKDDDSEAETRTDDTTSTLEFQHSLTDEAKDYLASLINKTAVDLTYGEVVKTVVTVAKLDNATAQAPSSNPLQSLMEKAKVRLSSFIRKEKSKQTTEKAEKSKLTEASTRSEHFPSLEDNPLQLLTEGVKEDLPSRTEKGHVKQTTKENDKSNGDEEATAGLETKNIPDSESLHALTDGAKDHLASLINDTKSKLSVDKVIKSTTAKIGINNPLGHIPQLVEGVVSARRDKLKEKVRDIHDLGTKNGTSGLLRLSGIRTMHLTWPNMLSYGNLFLTVVLFLSILRLIKSIVAAFSHRSVKSGVSDARDKSTYMPTDVTVILTTKRIDASMVEAVDSMLACEVIGVIIATEGLKREKDAARAISRYRPRVRVISSRQYNPRGLIVKALPYVETPLVALVEGNVSWPVNILQSSLLPFQDASVGMVVGAASRHFANRHRGLDEIGALENVYTTFLRRKMDEETYKTTDTGFIDGRGLSTSSPVRFIRSRILLPLDYRQPYLNDYWNGVGPLVEGGDDFTLRYLMRKGSKVVINTKPEAQVSYLHPVNSTSSWQAEALDQYRIKWRHTFNTLFVDRVPWWDHQWIIYASYLPFALNFAIIRDLALSFVLWKSGITDTGVGYVVTWCALQSIRYGAPWRLDFWLLLFMQYYDSILKLWALFSLSSVDSTKIGNPNLTYAGAVGML